MLRVSLAIPSLYEPFADEVAFTTPKALVPGW